MERVSLVEVSILYYGLLAFLSYADVSWLYTCRPDVLGDQAFCCDAEHLKRSANCGCAAAVKNSSRYFAHQASSCPMQIRLVESEPDHWRNLPFQLSLECCTRANDGEEAFLHHVYSAGALAHTEDVYVGFQDLSIPHERVSLSCSSSAGGFKPAEHEGEAGSAPRTQAGHRHFFYPALQMVFQIDHYQGPIVVAKLVLHEVYHYCFGRRYCAGETQHSCLLWSSRRKDRVQLPQHICWWPWGAWPGHPSICDHYDFREETYAYNCGHSNSPRSRPSQYPHGRGRLSNLAAHWVALIARFGAIAPTSGCAARPAAPSAHARPSTIAISSSVNPYNSYTSASISSSVASI